ncbi:diguanylate cyclase [Sphingomonas sp. NCPPB 2930]
MADERALQEALRRQLALLSEQFAQRLEGEFQALGALADALLQEEAHDAPVPAQLQPLRDRLHKIAGSAGTFGFPQLGETARRLERQAAQWLEHFDAEPVALRAFAHDVRGLRTEGLPARATPPEGPLVARRLAQGQSYRIFILEDDRVVGRNMELTLRNFGYDARHYDRAETFREACLSEDPDALVVDVHLGDDAEDGLALAADIQARMPQPVPLLVITSDNRFDIWLRAVRAGATGFFGKPVNLTDLENRLERTFVQQNGDPYRVMIVDDDLALAERYALVLRSSGMRVEVQARPGQVLEAMRAFLPEVLLLDVMMPGCSGPELAQIIRFHDDLLRIPIIYLSAETDIARQMDALLKAGDDFVTKPISDNALVATVFARAQRARLLSAALSRDGLTGLLRHADIKEQVTQEVLRNARGSKPASVAMIDIDHFKRINDTYGHSVGDNVIRSLANLLRQRLRRADQLGRYGGEEFVAVLPDCSPAQAHTVLDGIRQHFSQLEFIDQGRRFHVTLSAGIAAVRATDQPGETLERADRALYAAKHGGRDRIRLAPDEGTDPPAG